MNTIRCAACDKLTLTTEEVQEEDGTPVWVGRECARWVRQNGEYGYQPPSGGPKLYPLALGEEK
jgi:hypothetical protein